MGTATRSAFIAGLIFLILLAGGVYWTELTREVRNNDQNRLLRDVVIAQASAVERRLARSLSAAIILEHEVKRSQGDLPHFDSYADAVIESVGGISNLQLAPNGIISKIYPLAGNEKAIGHNILSDDLRRAEALLAVKKKRLTLAGPFTLLQGGEAVIGRKPVFLNKDGKQQFWGFTSVLIFLGDLLSVTDLQELESKGYSYTLSRVHPDTGATDIFARSESELTAGHVQSQAINVPNARWMLHVSDLRSFNSFAGYLASIIVALLLAYLSFIVLLQPAKLRRTVEEKTEQLKTMAFHDPLTGLANRRLLNEQLDQEIQSLLRRDSCAALLYIDLDDFKVINDSMGHDAGDALLKTVANRLRASLRKSDLVARLGGDEFAVLLLDTESVGYVRKIADHLIQVIKQPVELQEREVIVSATIGVTVLPGDARDVGTALRNADMAMYAAKNSGKRQAQFFDHDMQQVASQSLLLEQDLHAALKNDELSLMYQPIVCLRTREVRGFEALVRWQHPTLGCLAPARFIPVAEETGLIVPLGYWVIRQTCVQINKRKEHGLKPVSFAINLSPRQFSDPELGRHIQQILAETGVTPDSIDLEITETTLMDRFESAIDTLHELSKAGFSIAIDDFGRGYSSLSQLKHLPVDTLKIDRSFIDDVAIRESSDQKIVEAILAMAGKFDLSVVAEGIENVAQLALLEASSCEFGQGYLFNRPLSEEQMLAHPIELDTDWPTGPRFAPDTAGDGQSVMKPVSLDCAPLRGRDDENIEAN